MMNTIWNVLLKIARVIGRIQAAILLGLVYFVLGTPVACLYRCLADPLGLRRRASTPWQRRTPPADVWVWAKSQA